MVTCPDPRSLEGSSCGLDPNPSQGETPKVQKEEHLMVPKPPDCSPEVEQAAYNLLVQHGPIATEQVRHLVDLAPDSDMQRGSRLDPESKGDSSKCFITGAYVFSGMAGVRSVSFDYPCLTAALVRYVVQLDPTHTFTSVALFRDLKALPRADVFNEKGSVNLISPLSVFSGGDLWVADPQGSQVLSVKGKEVTGSILMVSKGTQKFVPQNLHAAMPWSGQRDVIVGFTPGRRDSSRRLMFLTSRSWGSGSLMMSSSRHFAPSRKPRRPLRGSREKPCSGCITAQVSLWRRRSECSALPAWKSLCPPS